jgi:chitodextrinase
MSMYSVPSGAPVNATTSHVTATSVRLRWHPPAPRHRNGLIILYEIVYRLDANFIDEWTTNTSDTTIVIEGLEPAKDYQFQIRAYTSQGSGQWSDQLQVRTASRTELRPPGGRF